MHYRPGPLNIPLSDSERIPGRVKRDRNFPIPRVRLIWDHPSNGIEDTDGVPDSNDKCQIFKLKEGATVLILGIRIGGIPRRSVTIAKSDVPVVFTCSMPLSQRNKGTSDAGARRFEHTMKVLKAPYIQLNSVEFMNALPHCQCDLECWLNVN